MHRDAPCPCNDTRACELRQQMAPLETAVRVCQAGLTCTPLNGSDEAGACAICRSGAQGRC